MKAKDMILLALGLGTDDADALDEWAKNWGVDLTPGLFEEAIADASPILDDFGRIVFGRIADTAARRIVAALDIDDDPELEQEFWRRFNVAPNLSAAIASFNGPDGWRLVHSADELADAAREWLDEKEAERTED